jgi:hypothetical protein
MKRILKSALALSILMFLSFGLYAQDEPVNKNYLWDISANMGSSLLWGDGATSASPFSRWFSKESNFTYGLTLKRKISNTFRLQAAFQKGMLSGERTKWSGDQYHAVVNTVTDFYDYHIGLDVDFTSLFGFKEDRFMSVYAFGGVGMINYKATSFNDGVLYKNVNSNTMIIPWGGGLRFRFDERWSAYIESNFRNTFVDDIEAYVGTGTDVNDIYSITGIGVTYRFGQKKEKKPKVEISPVEPADSAVAQVFVPTNIVYNSTMPTEAEPNSEYQVNTVIQKGKIKGAGKYSLAIPEDFYISDVSVNGGKVSQDSTHLNIDWNDMTGEQLAISYKLSSGGLENDSYIFTSSFSYDENGESKMKTFSDRVNLKPVVVASNNSTTEENATTSQTENVDNTQASNNEAEVIAIAPKPQSAGLEYRVQVAAVFGGTVSKRLLKKQLGLQQDVQEDPYKNSYRYTVGNYSTYSEAAQNMALSKVRGAYVVVFKDGKYVGGLEKTNTDIMDQDGTFATGDTYKVQIAASKGRTYSIAKLAYKYGLQENQIMEDEISGWYQYTVGKFHSAEEAKAMLNDIKLKVPKAYIVKFVDGKRSK